MPGKAVGVFKWRAVHCASIWRKEAMKGSSSNYIINECECPESEGP